MALNIDAKLEGKLTCAFKNNTRNLANFHQSTFKSLKIGTFIRSFYPKQKLMRLKFTGELSAMTMKNDSKFEKELTCQFKIDIRNLTNFDSSTQKSQNFAL